MTGKGETLRRVVILLLAPLRALELRPSSSEQPREADLLWHVGHAGFDACRALIAPFQPGEMISTRFGDRFHGQRNREPWHGDRPEPESVFAWWHDILASAEATLAAHDRPESLPEPVPFTAYTVHTLDEAYDYVIYHTSFHLGLAQGMRQRE